MAVAVPMTQHKYSTKIINAGALLDDTLLLLADWDLQQSVGDNLERVTRENSLAKGSRARLKEELVAFKGRYLGDASIIAALVTLVRAHAPPSLLHPILYALTIQADPLIGDFVAAQIAPLFRAGARTITTRQAQAWLLAAVEAGLTARPWSAPTAERVAQGILATLRDFAIIQGKAKKLLRQPVLAAPAFAAIAFLIHRQEPSAARVLAHPIWERFLMERPDVERACLRAHQENVLVYQAAGRVLRLDFPAATIEEYAHVLVERAL